MPAFISSKLRQPDAIEFDPDSHAWDEDSAFYDEVQEKMELSSLRDRVHRIGHINLELDAE